jgi:hypothetical protein
MAVHHDMAGHCAQRMYPYAGACAERYYRDQIQRQEWGRTFGGGVVLHVTGALNS